jgi:hypothetical protein
VLSCSSKKRVSRERARREDDGIARTRRRKEGEESRRLDREELSLKQTKWGRGEGESEGREGTRRQEKEREKRVIREVVEGGGYGGP